MRVEFEVRPKVLISIRILTLLALTAGVSGCEQVAGKFPDVFRKSPPPPAQPVPGGPYPANAFYPNPAGAESGPGALGSTSFRVTRASVGAENITSGSGGSVSSSGFRLNGGWHEAQ